MEREDERDIEKHLHFNRRAGGLHVNMGRRSGWKMAQLIPIILQVIGQAFRGGSAA
jgi:hypothetical protein